MRALSPLELFLALGILLGVGAHFVSGPEPGQRNLIYAPEMMTSPGYESQDPNPNFADGKTLQRPPEGTIARGYMPLLAGDLVLDTSQELWRKLPPEQQAGWDALRPDWNLEGLEEKARAKTEAAILARGQHIYTTFCVVCHGGTGAGDGPLVKRGIPPPKTFGDVAIRAYSDGRMFRSITFGSGNMASYTSQVEREDRWKVIRYIRSLQQAP